MKRATILFTSLAIFSYGENRTDSANSTEVHDEDNETSHDEKSATSHDGHSFDIAGFNGKIQLASPNGKKNNAFIKVSQNRIVEFNMKGEKVPGQSLGLGKDGDDDRDVSVNWVRPTTDNTTGILTTSFTKVKTFQDNSTANFTLTLHIATKTSSYTTDVVRCRNCTVDLSGNATKGSCQSAVSMQCAPIARDPAGIAEPTCPTDYTKCTVPVYVMQNTLKYSFTLSGWKRFQQGNFLSYGISVQAPNRNRHTDDDRDGKDHRNQPQKFKHVIFDNGFADMPATGFLNGTIAVPVNVSTTANDGGRLDITFTFAAPAPEDQFYYDPTFGTSDGLTSGASAVPPAVASLALAAMLLSLSL